MIFRAFEENRHEAPAGSGLATASDEAADDIFDGARSLYTTAVDAIDIVASGLPGTEVLALSIVGVLVVLFLITWVPFVHRLIWRAEHELEKEVRSHPGEYMSMTTDCLWVATILVGFAVKLLAAHGLVDLSHLM